MTSTINDAISDVDTDHDPTAGSPLFESIETGALERLFVPLDSDQSRDRGRVSFPFGGYTVSVTAEGWVTVRSDPGEESGEQ